MKALRTGRLVFALALAASIGALAQLGCQNQEPVGADGIAGPRKDPVLNEPPTTHLALDVSEGQMPDTSSSHKVVNWWGEDPDGRVVAYRYRWGQIVYSEPADSSTPEPIDTLWYDSDFNVVDTPVWTTTPYEYVDVVLPIRTVYATFMLEVEAIDNDGAIADEPATISFPVMNTKPDIAFRLGSNPVGLGDHPFYTFPIRTFVWDATDPDGNESIDKIFYVINPDTTDSSWATDDAIWNVLDRTETSVQLTDLTPGENVFYVKARDVAGFDSQIIHFPDQETSPSDPSEWIVKAPAGRYLIVDDYRLDSSNNALNFYRGIFDDLYGPEDEAYSVWELEVLPYSTQDVSATLALFDRVLWYSVFGQPKLTGAFNSMYTFINTPGKRMLLTTAIVDTGMVLDLADSVYTYSRRIDHADDDPVLMQPVDDQSLPEISIEFSYRPPAGAKAFIPSSTAQVIYQLDPSTHSPTPWYDGQPIVGLRREDKSYTLISIPLTNQLVLADDVRQLIQVTFDE